MSDIVEKLDKLALTATTIDDSLADIKDVVEISQAVDAIQEQLSNDGRPDLAVIFSGLSSVYEKIMLNDAPKDSGPAAVEYANEAVTLVRDILDGMVDAGAAGERRGSLLDAFKEKFDITTDGAPEISAEPSTVPVAEEAEQSSGKDGVEAGAEDKGPQPSIVKLIDENDLEIFEGFLDEATDQVNHIEEYIMTLEENPEDMDIVNAAFRVFHSLKGASGFLEMNEIHYLCHDAENLLDQARKSLMKVDAEFIDIILTARDVLENCLTSLDDVIREGKKNLPNFEKEVQRVDIGPVLDLIDRKLIKESGEADAVEVPKLGEILLDKGQVEPEKLREALETQTGPVGEKLVEMGAATKENVTNALDEQSIKKSLKSAAIKVDTNKLNTLLDLVGELVISQSIISQNEILLKEENSQLGKDIAEMAKITDGIQDHVMSLRMIPLRQTFQKMNRLVRDLARKTDKRVNFVIYGEQTEIDKTIVEQLNDPLVHLLRNSVDHGIDSVAERLESGKTADGTVTLGAYHQGGNVVIEIKDDGRGLNIEKIRQKGIERGLIQADKEYTKEEIQELIFHPGLSTNKVATAISGRGVGMDVVKRNIEQLDGRVEICTEEGKGTGFLVKLPLTMAIVDGMLVRVGTERYIIPTVAITESLKPKPEQISSVVQKGEVVNVRGELIPLLNMHDLLHVPNGNTNLSDTLVIIVGTETERRGLLVDDLLGQQQVVIKNLDKRLRGLS
ncbi:MAG: chemotaxis protein CheA, partial [Nitrospinota bacterium]